MKRFMISENVVLISHFNMVTHLLVHYWVLKCIQYQSAILTTIPNPQFSELWTPLQILLRTTVRLQSWRINMAFRSIRLSVWPLLALVTMALAMDEAAFQAEFIRKNMEQCTRIAKVTNLEPLFPSSSNNCGRLTNLRLYWVEQLEHGKRTQCTTCW